jgi:hypothetical protein
MKIFEPNHGWAGIVGTTQHRDIFARDAKLASGLRIIKLRASFLTPNLSLEGVLV